MALIRRVTTTLAIPILLLPLLLVAPATAEATGQVCLGRQVTKILPQNSGGQTYYMQPGDVVLGSRFNDTIHGTPGKDIICGGAGNDTLNGYQGDDIIYGDSGNDTINGGGGQDWVFGGYGDDRLIGAVGPDFLWGNEGNDDIFAGPGHDFVAGGSGADLLVGGPNNDSIFGDDGIDFLKGGEGRDTLYGGDGADQLWGGPWKDTFHGGPGSDWVRDGLDTELYFSGPGDVGFGPAPSTAPPTTTPTSLSPNLTQTEKNAAALIESTLGGNASHCRAEFWATYNSQRKSSDLVSYTASIRTLVVNASNARLIPFDSSSAGVNGSGLCEEWSSHWVSVILAVTNGFDANGARNNTGDFAPDIEANAFAYARASLNNPWIRQSYSSYQGSAGQIRTAFQALHDEFFSACGGKDICEAGTVSVADLLTSPSSSSNAALGIILAAMRDR